MPTTCTQCHNPLELTRINIDIIFTSKRQSESDRVFGSIQCLVDYIHEALGE